VLPPDLNRDADQLFERALELNIERADHAVWPLAERLGRLFGSSAAHPEILEQLTAAFLKPILATAIVDSSALAVLAALRERGVRTAVVSNTPWGTPAPLWRAELGRHGLLEAVDAAVFCVDVGYRKPHPAPIERALSLLGIPATDAAFIGDDPRWDVLGAQRAGVRPILLARQRPASVSDTVAVIATLDEVLDLDVVPSDPAGAVRPRP
jgi:putative hydrolase of the HAD superfamily